MGNHACGARVWALCPSDKVTRRKLATSLRVWGKKPTVQPEPMPQAKTSKDLVCRLLVEEVVVEEACQGRDAATLRVVLEADGPLAHGQLEDLGVPIKQVVAPLWVAGPSWPYMAVVV